MNKSILVAVALSSTVLISGCATYSTDSGPTYVETEPGYTGYTVGDGPYNISNGYGPEFWTPGNNNSLWYNRVYSGHSYYGGYYGGHGGYYGGHGGYVGQGGYAGGRGGYAHGGFAGHGGGRR